MDPPPAIPELGTPGPLGDDLYPALKRLVNFIKPHLKFLALIAVLLSIKSPSLLDGWLSVPIHYAGLALALYTAYYREELELHNVEAYPFLTPVLILLATQFPALFSQDWSDIVPLQYPGVLLAVAYIAYRSKEQEPAGLGNLKDYPLLIPAVLVVVAAQSPAGLLEWLKNVYTQYPGVVIAVAVYAVVQGQEAAKWSVPVLVLLALQSPGVIREWMTPDKLSGQLPWLLLLAVYAAYNKEQLGLQNLQSHPLLLPGLIVVITTTLSSSESGSEASPSSQLREWIEKVPEQYHGVILALAVYAALQNFETHPLLIIPALVALTTQNQIVRLPDGWVNVATAFLAVYHVGKSQLPKLRDQTLPILVGVVLATLEFTPVQKTGVFLGFYILYHGYLLTSNGETASMQVMLAFHVVSRRVGVYFKATSVAAVVLYMPIHHGLPLHYQTWMHCLVLAAAAVVGYFSPTVKFNGPVRFGYLQYRSHFTEIGGVVFDWWVYAVFFVVFPACLPFLGFGVMGICLAAWVTIYHEYTGKLQDVVDVVEREASRAKIAEGLSREYAASMDGYRKQILDTVSVARRDALMAESVRATDFFDASTVAWAAMEEIAKPVKELIVKAEETIYHAQEAEDVADIEPVDDDLDDEDENDNEDENGEGKEEDDDSDDQNAQPPAPLRKRPAVREGLARELSQAATAAKQNAGQVHDKLTAARDTVRSSQEAKAQHAKAREDMVANLNNAVSFAQTFETTFPGAATLQELYRAVTNAALVSTLGKRAVEAATVGEMEAARLLVGDVRGAADRVEGSKNKLCDAMKGARVETLAFIGVQAAELKE